MEIEPEQWRAGATQFESEADALLRISNTAGTQISAALPGLIGKSKAIMELLNQRLRASAVQLDGDLNGLADGIRTIVNLVVGQDGSNADPFGPLTPTAPNAPTPQSSPAGPAADGPAPSTSSTAQDGPSQDGNAADAQQPAGGQDSQSSGKGSDDGSPVGSDAPQEKSDASAGTAPTTAAALSPMAQGLASSTTAPPALAQAGSGSPDGSPPVASDFGATSPVGQTVSNAADASAAHQTTTAVPATTSTTSPVVPMSPVMSSRAAALNGFGATSVRPRRRGDTRRGAVVPPSATVPQPAPPSPFEVPLTAVPQPLSVPGSESATQPSSEGSAPLALLESTPLPPPPPLQPAAPTTSAEPSEGQDVSVRGHRS